MIVSEIYDELTESVGVCEEAIVFRALTRGIEMLAAKGLYDSLKGYLDYAVDGGYHIALPRDVKIPLRINIAGQPSFPRNQFFEFAANTNGSEEGEQVGWSWDDRGTSPIQDERKLPGKLKYLCSTEDDEGKICTVKGRDFDGREISEVFTANQSPTEGTLEFYSIISVIREQTAGECYLMHNSSDGDQAVARYYGDEIVPSYRVIKLSKSAESIRMIYRKHVFKITSQNDIINLASPMAVILATKAARLYVQNNYEGAEAALGSAAKLIQEEQATLDDPVNSSGDVITAINTNINTLDEVIVADVYDMAAQIFGAVGREKLFDRISVAIEALGNAALWDSMIGWVDIWRADNSDVNVFGVVGNGLFVLPRFVHSVLAINVNGLTNVPRNGWFEFHVNGTGERNLSACRMWDAYGRSPTLGFIPLDATTHKPIGQRLAAVSDEDSDIGKYVTVLGFGSDGKPLMTGAEYGLKLPITGGDIQLSEGQLVTGINRVKKDKTTGFVRLIAATGDSSDNILLGYYYPDEVSPTYSVIRLPVKKAARIRVKYKKRTTKVSSLYEPLHLRSVLAIENMMRAIKAQESDPNTAAVFEGAAVKYLQDEMRSSNPTAAPTLQFNSSVCPAVTRNFQ